MARIQHLLLVALTCYIYVNAAPSEVVTKLEDIAKVETAESEPKSSLEESNDESAPQGQRQKRWYDFGSFGFPPPINPVYPNYAKRDESHNTGVYGLVEDPISQVYRRIQDIAFGRQPSYPQPPQYPIYLPVIFVPQACNCNSQTPPQPSGKNGTRPDSVDSRFPVMDDTRQNWGYVINENDFIDNGEDPSRPINFDRIPPNGTQSRPPPPVEHGTVEGNGNSVTGQGAAGTGTTRRPPPPQNVPQNQLSMNELPTNCDAAILSCCHQPEITLECFNTQGCPGVNSYGNSCEPSVILKVIERFQRFYMQRTG